MDTIPRDQRGRFRPGFGGRKRGTVNKINYTLRQAILLGPNSTARTGAAKTASPASCAT